MLNNAALELVFDIGAALFIGMALGGVVYVQLMLSGRVKNLLLNSKYRKFLTVISIGVISLSGFWVVVVVGRFVRGFLSSMPVYKSVALALVIFLMVIYGLLKAARLLDK